MSGTPADLAQQLLDEEYEALNAVERRVLDQMASGKPTSRNPATVAEQEASIGDRLADRVAAIGGSWAFIVTFMLTLFAWMLINTDVLTAFGIRFDPYPFIFLNLILSMLAAVQAPIIMMSQNRQAAKDRLAARLDYETNLRAELDILRLHEKLDERVIARLDALETRIGEMVERRAKPD